MTASHGGTIGAVSFDLFGTLVTVAQEAEPSIAIERELETRGIDVPGDWTRRYSTTYLDRDPGAEVVLVDHVAAALEAAGRDVDRDVVRGAVIDAFDPVVETVPGAAAAVESLADRWAVGVLSNCSVPEIADRAIERSSIDGSRFDAVVTSEACGWRKPDERAFEAIAHALGVEPKDVVHVGDDPIADGGIDDLGGTAILVDDVSLRALPDVLEGREWIR